MIYNRQSMANRWFIYCCIIIVIKILDSLWNLKLFEDDVIIECNGRNITDM